MGEGTEMPFEGVSAMDHTADVGIEVVAPDLPTLFLRAARGMTHLILEGPPPVEREKQEVAVSGEGLDDLLRNWLREILYLHEAEGFAFSGADIWKLEEGRVEAAVSGGPDPSPPAREIKGVTFHGLHVRPAPGGGWSARVIFDV